MGLKHAGAFHRWQWLWIVPIYQYYVLMRLHPIISIEKGTTLSSCKPWLISVVCSWMCTWGCLGKYMIPEYLLTRHFTKMYGQHSVSTVRMKYLWNSGVFYVYTPII